MASNNSQIDNHMQTFRQAFAGPEHRTLHRECGRRGVLLVHGFVGTPAEMAPIAETLYAAGWTVDVPLLPGHGPEIDRLFEVNAEDWVAAARRAGDALKATHTPFLLVGHSMGAAVATALAAELEPAGVILLSPFLQLPLDNIWLRIFAPVLRLVLRRVRPFQTVDFDRRELRQGIREFVPELDIDDPEVQAEIRDMTVPTRLLVQLEQLGKRAYRAAPTITAPTLILQGTQDEVARPDITREFLSRIGGPLTYCEVDGAHDLVRRDGPAWEDVAWAVRAFAEAWVGPDEV